MNISELERSLRQLRLGGMAAVLENRLRQAQAEKRRYQHGHKDGPQAQHRAILCRNQNGMAA